MKKILFASYDYSLAKEWADKDAPAEAFITSHRVGTRTDRYQNEIESWIYEVCIDVEDQSY